MKRLMIYTRKHNFRNSNFNEKLRINSSYILFQSFIMCGIIAGSTCIYIFKYEHIKTLINKIIFEYSNLEFFSLYSGYSLLFIIICLMNGLNSLGYPLICLTLFIRGFGDGFIPALLFDTYEIKGFAIYCLIFIPAEMINLTSLLYTSAHCSKISGAIASYVFFGNKENIYIKNSTVIIILSISISMLTSLLMLILRNLFSGLI